MAASALQIIKQLMLAAKEQFGAWRSDACHLQPVEHGGRACGARLSTASHSISFELWPHLLRGKKIEYNLASELGFLPFLINASFSRIQVDVSLLSPGEEMHHLGSRETLSHM